MGIEHFDLTLSSPKARVEAYINSYRTDDMTYQGFEAELMREHLRVVSSTESPRAITVFELTVPATFCNRLGILHGGAVALIMDMCTSAAQAPRARADFWHFGGLSRTMNLTYLRPAPLGTIVLIEAEVIHQGKDMALIKGEIKRKDNGAVMYTVEHGKFNPNASGRL